MASRHNRLALFSDQVTIVSSKTDVNVPIQLKMEPGIKIRLVDSPLDGPLQCGSSDSGGQ